jgi:hypothetical protein
VLIDCFSIYVLGSNHYPRFPAVMNDLLYAFMGLDGQHVRAVLVPGSAPIQGAEVSDSGSISGPSISFQLATALQPTSHELVQRLLPLW